MWSLLSGAVPTDQPQRKMLCRAADVGRGEPSLPSSSLVPSKRVRVRTSFQLCPTVYFFSFSSDSCSFSKCSQRYRAIQLGKKRFPATFIHPIHKLQQQQQMTKQKSHQRSSTVPSSTTVIDTDDDTMMTSDNPLPDSDSRYADIEGILVHHKYKRLENAPLAVCIHGFGANLFSFELVAPQLTKFLSICIFDTPGFGFTSRSNNLDCYTSRFTARITRSLALAYNNNNNNKIEDNGQQDEQSSRYILIGHSLGSVAAISTTLTHPDEVSALILIAPALLPPSDNKPSMFMSMLSGITQFFLKVMCTLTQILKPLLVPFIRLIVTPESFWKRALVTSRASSSSSSSSSSPVDDAVVMGYRRPITAENWEKGVINFVRASFLDRARAMKLNVDYIAELITLPRDKIPPILIVHGQEDKLVPLENSIHLQRILPNAQISIMQKVGHCPHEEKPEEFANIVETYLQSLGLTALSMEEQDGQANH